MVFAKVYAASLLVAIARGDIASSGLEQASLGEAPANTALPAIAVRLVRSTRILGGLSFFVGRVAVGDDERQHFEVLFDTASGNVILPSSSCTSSVCVEHHRYQHQKSSEVGEEWEIEFSQMELGSGVASGPVVRDRLCVGRMLGQQEARGRAACAEDLHFVASKNMTDVPFRAMPHDGIVGLGLQGLWVGPKSGFLDQLVSSIHGLLPQYSLSFGRDEGELRFGGYDPTRLTAPLEWFPVANEDEGFWQVWMRAVRIGNHTIDFCSTGCRAIIDTGASGLAVPKVLLPRLRAALAPSSVAGGGCKGPDLHLDLGSSTALKLRAEDYAGPSCQPQLVPLDIPEQRFANVFVFGVNVLRPYYTVFDWGAKRIGFSRVSGRFVRISDSERPDAIGGMALGTLMV
mmetsp:Transcript_14524/g.27135  ORF Transcript_14524/g.27135 Transcript_14524/m.27135 type:complete len:402 (-) Transcript_14524:43-1248(-)